MLEGKVCRKKNSILAAALIPEVESLQLAVSNQKQSLLRAGKSADGNADHLEAAVFAAEIGLVRIGWIGLVLCFHIMFSCFIDMS